MRAGERGGWCQKAKSSSITAGSEQMTHRIDKSRNSSISISFRDLEATTGRNGELKAAASGGGGHWMLVFTVSLSILFDSLKHVRVLL